jgi:hypothetical protein
MVQKIRWFQNLDLDTGELLSRATIWFHDTPKNIKRCKSGDLQRHATR